MAGLSGSAWAWFFVRPQRAQFVLCGVPQESVLGPLLLMLIFKALSYAYEL